MSSSRIPFEFRFSGLGTPSLPNQSFERTRTGILQLGIISFLPNRSLPARAAQLQRYAAMKYSLIALLWVAAFEVQGSPCSGVDRTLTEARKVQLAPLVARQMGITSAEILQSYKYQSWYIIYVNTHVSDEAFLFYPGDPSRTKYLTAWGGGAGVNEGPEVLQWLKRKAKGIPNKLASCFAWHVTKDRDL